MLAVCVQWTSEIGGNFQFKQKLLIRVGNTEILGPYSGTTKFKKSDIAIRNLLELQKRKKKILEAINFDI